MNNLCENIKIETFNFGVKHADNIEKYEFKEQWPVVYIIHGKKEAYIGETVNLSRRIEQHLENNERCKLTKINVIGDKRFNKSVVLALESYLIKYMSGDGKFKLQNKSVGLSHHNYYQMEKYKFNKIWEKLNELGLVEHTIKAIENSDLFKYSPYKELTDEQLKVSKDILKQLVECDLNNEKCSIIINGEPGTGKTILAIYLMKMLATIKDYEDIEDEGNEAMQNSQLKQIENMKFGFVVPMKSLRKTLKKVFKSIQGLNSNMVISPIQCLKEKYDILIVDESHRLRRRLNLSGGGDYTAFDKNNAQIGLGDDGTELDWIWGLAFNLKPNNNALTCIVYP